MLNLLRKSSARKQDGQALYDSLVSRARAPVFFTRLGVADSIDGRFDLLALHAWLALAALKTAGLDDVAQGLTDAIFVGFDEAMREQGAGDMGLGRKMKAFADAFFGRMAAYETATDEDGLAAALARNLYRGAAVDAHARTLAVYATQAKASLAQSVPGALDFALFHLPESRLYDGHARPVTADSLLYLARLGNSGDTVRFAADADQRAAIASWSGVLSLEEFSVAADIRKLAFDRFALDFTVTVNVNQACVVTLEKVPAHLERRFSRELQFVAPVRRKSEAESVTDIVLDSLEDEGPEAIENLNYDLAAPVLEDYVLALDPYPRCPGVAFEAPSDGVMPPESPFAVLKGLKSGL